MTTAWWDGLPPVEVEVVCSDQTHRVEWRDGDLIARDHDDPEGERTLAALGGDRCTCIGILDDWARHHDDLRVLVLGSRGAADPVHLDPDSLGPQGMGLVRRPGGAGLARSMAGAGLSSAVGWTAFAPLGMAPGGMGGPPFGPADDVVGLLTLGGALFQRLVATVLASWTERTGHGGPDVEKARPALQAALYGRVVASLRTWLSSPGLEIELDMIDGSEPASLAQQEGTIHARLPFSWLLDIWVKDLSIVLGRFSVGPVMSGEGHLRVLTVNLDLNDVRPVTISLG